ncbi:Scavenger mRNA decapping enzyme C-term binding domain-containing protein, partial [Rozella allomycis CSF55]
ILAIAKRVSLPNVQKNKRSHWTEGLRVYLDNPSKYQDEIIYSDSQVVMIKDMYPKSKYHYLILPRNPHLLSILDLNESHIPLLRHFKEVAARDIPQHAKSTEFNMGFHMIPSMNFFMKIDEIIQQLLEFGRIKVDETKAKSLLKSELKCNSCEHRFSTFVALKDHLFIHNK